LTGKRRSVGHLPRHSTAVVGALYEKISQAIAIWHRKPTKKASFRSQKKVPGTHL